MPLTVTSITRSGVSLTVARCTTCVTPAIASSQTARSPIEPLTTSSPGVSGSVRLLQSALITPVADPQTGSTVALLVCANAKAGRFAVHDELFAEGAAYHLGLLWQHHIQLLRLVPLPGAPLAPPDEAAALLQAARLARLMSRRRTRQGRLG